MEQKYLDLEQIGVVGTKESANFDFGYGAFNARRVEHNRAYRRKLYDFANFYGQILEGRRPTYQLREAFAGNIGVSEALTPSDLPLLFGDTLNRSMLAAFSVEPQDWRAYVKVNDTVKDFRDVKPTTLDGLETPLTQVGTQSEYPEAQPSESQVTYRLYKYGRVVPLAWEAIQNDDLNALRELPSKLARAAARGRTKKVASLLADANGPHASFFTSGNANIVTSNPVLSLPALATALEILDGQTDTGGDPIFIEAVHLVIPRALRVRAENIAAMQTVDITENAGGGSTNQRIRVGNWIIGKFTIHVNEYLSSVASSANGNTQWYVLADPSQGRPAIEMGFMLGRGEPQMLMKASDQSSLDGSLMGPLEGDFATDTVRYKIRDIYGGAQIEPRAAVASQGDGS